MGDGSGSPRSRPSSGEPGLAAGLGEGADAQDVGGALGDTDGAAGVEQVEKVARLQALVIGGQRQMVVDQLAAFLFGIGKMGGVIADAARKAGLKHSATVGSTLEAAELLVEIAEPGDLVLMAAFGGGFTWGAALVRW